MNEQSFNNATVKSIKKVLKVIQSGLDTLNDINLVYYTECLLSSRDLLVNKYLPFKVGDRVVLTSTPDIDKSHGWQMAKHFLVKGAVGSVVSVDIFSEKPPTYFVCFDDEFYVDGNGKRYELDYNIAHGAYSFTEDMLAPLATQPKQINKVTGIHYSIKDLLKLKGEIIKNAYIQDREVVIITDAHQYTLSEPHENTFYHLTFNCDALSGYICVYTTLNYHYESSSTKIPITYLEFKAVTLKGTLTINWLGSDEEANQLSLTVSKLNVTLSGEAA